MKMRWLQPVLALLLGMGPVSSACAEDLPWFEVELIVFEQAGSARVTEDVWPDESAPAQREVAELLPAVRGTPPQPYEQLQPHERHLTEVAKLLASSGRRPLLHVAWRQPVYGASQALPVRLSGGDALAELSDAGSEAAQRHELEGTVRLLLARYLHVQADLRYHRSSAAERGFRLVEQRRLRRGELNYFDHPAFGMLVMVTPYQPAAEGAVPPLEEPPEEPDEAPAPPAPDQPAD